MPESRLFAKYESRADDPRERFEGKRPENRRFIKGLRAIF